MSLTIGSLGFISVPTPGTPVQLSSSVIVVASARIQPRKNATTVNIGNVYIKNPSGAVYAILSPEQTEGVELLTLIGQSRPVDLSQWYVDADNANDAVLVGYMT